MPTTGLSPLSKAHQRSQLLHPSRLSYEPSVWHVRFVPHPPTSVTSPTQAFGFHCRLCAQLPSPPHWAFHNREPSTRGLSRLKLSWAGSHLTSPGIPLLLWTPEGVCSSMSKKWESCSLWGGGSSSTQGCPPLLTLSACSLPPGIGMGRVRGSQSMVCLWRTIRESPRKRQGVPG